MRRSEIQSLAIAALTVGVLLASATAMATELGEKLRLKGISGSIGLGIGYVPDYEGSNDYDVVPFPIMKWGWGDGLSAELIGGETRVDFVRSNTWAAGPKLNFRLGRDDDVEDSSVKLFGEDGIYAVARVLGDFPGLTLGGFYLDTAYISTPPRGRWRSARTTWPAAGRWRSPRRGTRA